jgi:hypothetical protein
MKKDKTIGWRDGKYIYCDSHDSSQVSNPKPAKLSDPDIYEGIKCAWCRKKLA